MRISITGKNIAISEGLTDRVNKKVGKLSRYFHDDTEAVVRLTLDKQRNIAEVTIPIKGRIIRAQEESLNNMFQAIDDVCEKIERQVHRNRTRLEKRLKSSAFQPSTPEYSSEAYMDDEADYGVVREKRFMVKPMPPEDAIEQMELLGHTFFLFMNSQTNTICAVYRRNDGHHGLLIPEEG